MHRSLSLGLVVAALAVTAAPGVAVADSPDGLRWGACPEGVEAPGLECATLEVPLDYADPDGRQIEIAVSRLASEEPAERRGALMTNPGGPGGSGLAYPAQLAAGGLPQEVLDAYDVIGFAPRGVGESTRVTCDLTEEQQSRGNFPTYAHTDADVEREAEYARDIAERCGDADTAWMLPHLTTANTARDMDRIREALGESTVSYLGASYGTYLGSVYAEMFPERGDRMVLDSALGAGGYDFTAMRRFAPGFEDRFPDFAEYAAAHPEYGLGTTPEEVTETFFELAERLDAEPSPEGVDGTLFRGLTFDRLYVDALMPQVAEAWQALDTGQPLPSLPPVVGDMENLMASRFAVICADSEWPDTVEAYQEAVAVDRERHPMLGGSVASVNPCAFWPAEATEPPVRIGDEGPSNILIVQNERDPGTPLAGARELRETLGQRAVLVTADQGGHGVYPFGSNTCANDSVTAYLTTGERPSQDLACAAEPAE
ncbi:TAP-like protein [Streptomyces zhaozhouensis]|uniref:TAP-like protein n=1 Tax=Streptomyces zhaozhouensis TaxID=1300267 RepID=A0A286E0M2_9ACTN|nr:alpha/beta hydrolase [Streptomyces zhaozhouensis]SOD64410.1 TAP-like protein [Streptomyces zhaozhouensis]